MTEDYNSTELLATVASKILEDERTVMVGTGMPMLAAMLAQKTHAPDITLIYEAGGIGAESPAIPVSVGDERTFHRGIMAAGMHEVMSYGQAGMIDYGFLGGAQLDKHGNLNSTVIGDWEQPAVRFPGSGGANDIGSWANETIIAIQQSEDTFVDELNFLTTPGYLDGEGAREEAGLPANSGPGKVITQLGVYTFDDEREMVLDTLHPGVDVEEVNENSSFEIKIPDDFERSPKPTEEEIRLLREEIDPRGVFR